MLVIQKSRLCAAAATAVYVQYDLVAAAADAAALQHVLAVVSAAAAHHFGMQDFVLYVLCCMALQCGRVHVP